METKQTARKRRHARIRKKLYGTGERPRLCIYKSNKNIYAQLVDDGNSKTLFSVSTLSPRLKGAGIKGASVKNAAALAEALAEKMREKGIKSLVFDRSGYIYHGKVKAVAETLRKSGFVF